MGFFKKSNPVFLFLVLHRPLCYNKTAYFELKGEFFIMIRLAVPEDFTSLMSIYAYARSFMQETGNPNQWGNHFPPEELIHNRIRDKQLFVLEENGTLHGAFAFIIGEDPTYLQIDDGSWLSDAPYGTIHQVASDGTIHGFFSQIVDYCWTQIPHLRVDTHTDNQIMQHLIQKNGFETARHHLRTEPLSADCI